jgi:hypothetical protein
VCNTFNKYYHDDQINKDETVWIYSTYGGDEKFILATRPKKRRYLGDIKRYEGNTEVRNEVSTAVQIGIVVLWVTTQCSLEGSYQPIFLRWKR